MKNHFNGQCDLNKIVEEIVLSPETCWDTGI